MDVISWNALKKKKMLETISQFPKTFQYQKSIMPILAWDSVERMSKTLKPSDSNFLLDTRSTRCLTNNV